MDKLSAQSLEIVGTVVLDVITGSSGSSTETSLGASKS